jgi:hypothetical protein
MLPLSTKVVWDENEARRAGGGTTGVVATNDVLVNTKENGLHLPLPEKA